MNDMYKRIDVAVSPSLSSRTVTIQHCISRIEVLLDEEMEILNQGKLNELERTNMRKSHLLVEFDRLSKDLSVGGSYQVQLRMDICRRKAQRNFEALEAYLCAMEDLNQLILSHLRKEESDGTYSRPVLSHLRG